jgi:phytoene dehydrogenase-like protein
VLTKGGMHEITNSLVKLKEIGVEFHFNQEVTAIETEKTLVKSVNHIG